MLLAMAYQYNGKNNGDMTASLKYMKEHHGFNSSATLARALKELLKARLISMTRTSLFQKHNNQCALYELTWFPRDECNGKLDLPATGKPLREFLKPLVIGKNNKLGID